MKPDLSISQILSSSDRPLLSYEFFPPKTEKSEANLMRAIDGLRKTEPDFVTVTYGAGGSTQEKTLRIATALKDSGMGPVMPHLTCVGSSQEELKEIALNFYQLGFRNIMTLRGDPPHGDETFVPAADGLAHANELVELLKGESAEFCCGVAGNPEDHPESPSSESDLKFLKNKVDAGGDFITTQLFFDNQIFFDWVKRCRDAGISVPILPGLLPASSLKQLERFTKLCGSSFPDELRDKMNAVGGDGPEAEEVGRLWCLQQIQELIDYGVDGIHLYILNQEKQTLTQPAMELVRSAPAV